MIYVRKIKHYRTSKRGITNDTDFQKLADMSEWIKLRKMNEQSMTTS